MGADDKGYTSDIGSTGNHSTKAEVESWGHRSATPIKLIQRSAFLGAARILRKVLEV